MTKLTNWNVAGKFTGRQAAALVAGVDPDSAAVEPRAAINSPMLQRMKSSYNAKRRWYEDDGQPPQCDEPESVVPEQMFESLWMHWLATTEPDDSGAFLTWLKDDRLSGFESQIFTREEIARWLAASSLKSAYSFTSQEPQTLADKPLVSQERKSLHKLVLAMAVSRYKYDPSAGYSTATAQIESDAAKIGLQISVDTVRKYLKLAAAELEWTMPPKP